MTHPNEPLSAEVTERSTLGHRGIVNLIPYQKGQSGNPGGRTREFAEFQRFCREKSLANAQRIAEIAGTTKDERLAFMAYAWLVERAWGKPKDYDPKEEGPAKPRFDPRLLSREQLEIVQYALRLMVQATRAPGDIDMEIEQEPG
jgi:hypothetical protein